MNFLKNPLSSIGNAVEINTLKSKIDDLNKQKTDVEKKCIRYDENILLKTSANKIVAVNNEVITEIRNLFAIHNVNYDMTYEEFITKYFEQIY